MRRCWLAIPPLFLFAAGAAAGWWSSPGEEKLVTPAVSAVAAPATPAVTEKPGPPGEREVFLQQLEATSAEDFPALWAEVKKRKPEKSPLSLDNSIEELLLFARWAEVDPLAAAGAAEEDHSDGSLLLSSVFGIWAERDPDAALAAADSLKADHRMNALEAIFKLAMRTPDELTPWMQRLAPFLGNGMPQDLFSQAMRPRDLAAAAAKDPAAFREMTAALPEEFRRPFLMAEWCAAAAKDLPAALARMESLKLSSNDGGKLLQMLLPLTTSQPATLAAVAEKLPAGWIGASEVPPHLLIALAKAAPDKIHQLTDAAGSLGAGASIETHSAALLLFDSDPQLALKLSGGGDGIITEIFGNDVPDMARTQPQAALDLLRSAPPSTLRESILMESLTRLRQESPEAARQWVESLENGSLKDSARVLVEGPELSRTAAQFGMALATASAADAPGSSQYQLSNMLKRFMLTDPETTVAQISTLPAGALRENTLRTAGQEWAGSSTPDALAWSETLTGAERVAAQSGIVRKWAEYEPAAASEFVQELPPGEERDGPAAALARGVSQSDPRAGLAWAASITGSEQRLSIMREVAGEWLEKSPEAARQAILEMPGINEAERTTLLQPPAK
jgi:hypothetical protein